MHAIEYQTAYAWFVLLLSITPTAPHYCCFIERSRVSSPI